MGNYFLRKGMEYLSDNLGTPIGRILFDETILIAPDLSSKDLEVTGWEGTVRTTITICRIMLSF